MIAINVGGQQFVSLRSTWERSPRLRDLLKSDPAIIDRNPAVFNHIHDWLRHGRLFIEPDDITYERLRDDAAFYKLADLSAFLSNRANLCRIIYFQAPDGRFPCNVAGFRKLEPSNGIIDHLLSKLHTTTVKINMRLRNKADILADPCSTHIKECHGDLDEFRRLFGDRITVLSREVFDEACIYEPRLRLRHSV